ncbi:hypothetical protein [Tenggerimyces flavus]|uniref:Uncharacterized protein n=1 Tax=Tenggerimyces flavus TaxID=1708749 RepID=A0ABV7Y841_9ACTN|nr:hypothetical protein [Tenggerimyces flavus]MBM7790981.1 hypothetical protein [Tenggerimyces flavus]
MRDLDVIAGELYATPPSEFVAKRDEEAKSARDAGDRTLAAALKKLARPTQGAWLVNLLWRSESDLVESLFSLGAELGAAQRALDGDEIRSLSASRQKLMSKIAAAVRRLGADRGVRITADLSREVESTLDSALADEEVAALVRSGRVVKSVTYAGFGPFGGDLSAVPTLRSVPSPAKKKSSRASSPEDEDEDAARAKAEARLADAREVLEEAEEDYTEREQAFTDMESSRDSLRERLDELREEIRDTEAQLLAAERGLRAEKRRYERAESTLEQARKRLAEAEDAAK